MAALERQPLLRGIPQPVLMHACSSMSTVLKQQQ